MAFDIDFTMTVGGRAVETSGRHDVLNPANEQVIAQAPLCTKDQLDLAVAAARRAFPGWRDAGWDERRGQVAALGDVVLANLDPLTRMLTAEQGKPLGDAEAELRRAAEWLVGTAGLSLPDSINEDNGVRRSVTRHVPIGVVGAIAPWNFPVALAIWKIAPALMAGNSVVLKPSPFTPLTTLRLGGLLAAHLPEGVLNIVSGSDDLGAWMTAHPGIDKISFTGSTQTGRQVMAGAAPTLKRLTLELGGNDAAIVLPDVNVADVAPKLFWAGFRNAGQICIASKRLYVHEQVYSALAEALSAYAATVRVGNGAEPGTQIGPVQNAPQYRRVRDLVDEAAAQGFRFLSGGSQWEGPGYFQPVTLVDNPPEDSRIVREEQFGPILPLIRVGSVDEALARANRSEFGLGASVWSGDIDEAERLAGRLEAGTVWINEEPVTSPLAPFAGHKQSGVGVENGIPGLAAYTNTQTIVTRRAAGRPDGSTVT